MPINFNPFVRPQNRTATPFNFTLPFRNGNSCAPVTIYDPNGNVVATVVSGGSYVEGLAVSVRTVTFVAGSTGVAHTISFNAYADSTITQTSATNVATVVYYNHTTAQTLTSPFQVSNHDEINITVTPTNPALDCVLVLTGVLDSVVITSTFPAAGPYSKLYTLDIPDRTLSVNDLSVNTFPNLATIALGAYTQGTPVYRHINQSVYVLGFNGANTFTVERIDALTDTLVATSTFAVAAPGMGFGTMLACYDWMTDKIYAIGQGGANTPFATYDPVTDTATFSFSIDLLPGYSNMIFMGFADHLEGCFFLSGLNTTSVAYLPLGGGKFRTRFATMRGGVVGVAFSPENRLLYMTTLGQALRWYDLDRIPEINFSAGPVQIAGGGLACDTSRNVLWGCSSSARTIGYADIPGAVTGGFTAAAVGAETAFKCVRYNPVIDKVFFGSRGGNIVRVVDAATKALDATTPTITVGNQSSSQTIGFTSMCFNGLQI